jgi:hypothetical protein
MSNVASYSKSLSIDVLLSELTYVYPQHREKIQNWIAENMNKSAERWKLIERTSMNALMTMILMGQML